MASTPIRARRCCMAIVSTLVLLTVNTVLRAEVAVPMSVANASNQAPAFTLRDQHKAAHHYQFPRPKLSVLIFADYAGAAQLENWIRPLYDRYQDAIAIDGVAELSSVPKLIRGMVRSAFRDRLAQPVMLDWSGGVSTDYHYQKGEANLFVIDPNGRILLKVVGAISDAKFKRVQDAIDRQLKGDRP